MPVEKKSEQNSKPAITINDQGLRYSVSIKHEHTARSVWGARRACCVGGGNPFSVAGGTSGFYPAAADRRPIRGPGGKL